MSESYSVRLTKDYLVFSAAHFITYGGDICERLHGHNYRVEAEVFGPLDQNHYVVDFIFLRDTLKQLVDQWDHHMLLPTRHEMIRVSADDKEVLVRFRERRWVFPKDDCILLPVPNTTSELLANCLGQCLIEAWSGQPGSDNWQLRIGVDENNGQWGYCNFRVAKP